MFGVRVTEIIRVRVRPGFTCTVNCLDRLLGVATHCCMAHQQDYGKRLYLRQKFKQKELES